MANRCFFCCKEESIHRIFIHCNKTRVVWHLLFSLFVVSWVLPSLVGETLISWHEAFVGRKRKKVWQAAPLCLFWTIWKEMNSRGFENKEYSVHRIKINFFFLIFGHGPIYL